MSEFHKAFYVNCPIHKDVEHPIWRKCPKCSVIITYTEEEVKEIAYKANDRGIKRVIFNSILCDSFEEWFEQNKKK